MSNIAAGSKVRITVTFRQPAPEGELGDIVDPISVVVKISDIDNVLLDTLTPVKRETGVFYIDWEPTDAGRYWIEFLGTMPGSPPYPQSIKEWYDVDPNVGPTGDQTLGEDYVITFMAPLSPLYIDPEEIQVFYPDATLAEIAEMVYFLSLEMDDLFGGKELSFTAVEYIKAATLCQLSKIYDGLDEDAEITLGDLHVIPSKGGEGATRASAHNWCDWAAVLRAEVYKAGMKAIVKGSNFRNPIPSRHIRRRVR